MRLIDIIKKDVLLVLRDKKALVFIFLMPIVLIVILGFALSGLMSNDGVSIGQINIALVDEVDDGEIAQANVQFGAAAGASYKDMSLYSVLDSNEVRAFISYGVMDADAAQSRLEAREVDAVVTIPKGYAQGLAEAMTGGGSGVQIDVSGRSGEIATTVINSVVQSYADTLSSVSADMAVLFRSAQDAGQSMAELDIGAFIQNAVNTSIADVVVIEEKGVEARKVLNMFFYYTIAITCMFILYSAGQGSTFLYTESDEKTLARLLAAGISKKKLLLGKSFAVCCLCIIQLIVLFSFSTIAFGLSWGNAFVFVAISICVAVSVTGLGVLLMVLVYRAGNPRIGNIFQSVLVQILALFGGSYIPLSMLPKFFSKISIFTPNGLAVHAYTANVSGAPFSEVLPYIAGSLAFGIVLYFVGVVLFPRERRA